MKTLRLKRIGSGRPMRSLATVMVLASATFAPTCAGDDASTTGAGGASGAPNNEASTGDGSAGQGGDDDGGDAGSVGEASSDRDGPAVDARRNCAPLIVGGRMPRPPAGVCPVDAAEIFTIYACLPRPPEGITCEDAYNESCVLSTYACGGTIYGTSILCGPVADGAANCCYLMTGECRPD